MKRLQLLLALISSIGINAQEYPKYVYAQIIGEERIMSNKMTVTIDYGQATSYFNNNKVQNENGSNRKFNSMIEAMNEMGFLGWELKQAYTVPNGNNTTFHWIVQRKILDPGSPSEEEIRKKFPTKKDLNPSPN